MTIAKIVTSKAGAVLRFLVTEPKVQLMAFTQFGFGFYIAFLNFYVNAHLVPPVFSPDYIGLFAALGAVPWVSFLRRYFAMIFGTSVKTAVLALMVVSISAMAAPFLIEGDAHHYPKASVFLLYFVAGVARSSYEFANRSIFVDFFPDDKEEAMPCILLLSSITKQHAENTYNIAWELVGVPFS